MAKIEHSRHFLYHGELTDAPGRNESWDCYVRYRGKNRWELITIGTDFDGRGQVEPTCQRMSTATLVSWILERDAEIAEESRGGDQIQAEDIGEMPRILGPYGERLLEISVEVDAPYCASTLKKWLAGARQGKQSQPAIRISAVTGVAQRGVWLRVFHRVYLAETNLGPAFLYPPDEHGSAKLVLKTESSMTPGRMVKVPKALLDRIEELKPALAELGR